MVTEVAAAPIQRATDWTPARIFMVASAIFHIPVGILGLAINQSFPVGSAEAADSGSDHILGVLATNGWHSVLALLVGVVSLYFAVRPERAREVALAIGLSHVAVWVALVLWEPSTFWIASNGADQVVHATTAVTATTAGLLTRRHQ